jgi:hypothetical protein
MRTAGSALLIALGVLLLGLDLRPVAGQDEIVRMTWSFFGAHRPSGFLGALPAPLPCHLFAAQLRHALPWLGVVLTAAAILLGVTSARVFTARSSAHNTAAMRVGCVIAWGAVLNPWIAMYVATRDPANAPRYIDVGDVFRALGIACMWVAVALWSGGSEPAERTVPDSPRAGRGPGVSIWLAMLVAMLVPAVISWQVLDRFPLTNDEHAYLFQARLFAHGQITRDVGALSDFFPSPQSQCVRGRVFSVIVPGHSAVLAIGAWLGWPDLLPRLLAALSVALTWSIGTRLSIARPDWGAWCLALSPAFIGVESLWLSHATSLPFAWLAVWATLESLTAHGGDRRKRATALAVLAGSSISVVFAARPVTAIAVGVTLLILVVREWRAGLGGLLGVALVSTIPVLVGFALVNQALTGSVLHTAYDVYNRAANAVYGNVSPALIAEIQSYNLSRLSVWLIGVAPALLLLFVGFTLSVRGPRTWILAAMPIAMFAVYALHPFPGIPWVGAVYLSDALPASAMLAAQGLAILYAAYGPRLARAAMVACICGSALLLYEHFSLAREEITLRERPYAAARDAGIRRGIVFLRLHSSQQQRVYPLAPPEPGDAVVFARDLGARDSELVRALGDPPAWVWDADTGELRQLAL